MLVAANLTTRPSSRGASWMKGKKPKLNTFVGVERWIWDTGSGVDVCSQEHTPKSGEGLVKIAEGLSFNTANGPVDAGPVYPGLLRPLDEAIAPYIMESSPPLLSVGKRCMKKGFGFFWFPWKLPLVTTPGGELFMLEVLDNVPYLRHDATPVPVRDTAEIRTDGARYGGRKNTGGFKKIRVVGH